MTRSLPSELTSFVGRERLLADVQRLLAPRASTARLVTLTGPGGTGKTRIALQAARALHDQFEDSVYFVALASITDPNLVASTIVQSVGALNSGRRPPLENLRSFLRDRQALLVLDNFEQVLGAAADLAELLTTCPKLTILVTSRAALRVSGERELAIAPLALPSAQAPLKTGALADVESVQLFMERARAVRSDFTLTDDNASAVAEICVRLDGLPLAIELAAARSRLLTPEAILARLEHRLQFLTGGAKDVPARQQTLRNTIVWSYDLLDSHEQALFNAAAVFAGGCTLDALRSVCPVDLNVYDVADSLVAKSLLRPMHAPHPEVRVTMLETTREFGLEQLAWNGQLEVLRRRHADYFLALAEEAEPHLWGPAVGTWLVRLETEHDNIRAAIDWGLSAPTESGAEVPLRLLGALSRFYWTRSHGIEALPLYARAFDLAPQRSEWRMKALHGAGWLAHFDWDAATARHYLGASLDLALERGDEWTIAWVQHVLGRVAYFDGDANQASTLGEQSLVLAERLDDRWLIGWALHLLGLAAHIRQDYGTADDFYARSLAIRQSVGHTEAIGVLLQLMGISAYRQGEWPKALQYYRDYVSIGRELGSSFHLSHVLAQLACLAAAQQQPERAARLFGATLSASESSRIRTIPLTEALLREGMDLARTALGEAAFEAAFARGRMLSLNEAVAEALAVEVRGAQTDRPTPRGPELLTEREREVAALVQRGLTNRQIAAELVVTDRTVAAHVEHILAKLGFASRTQIAVWAATELR